jgi:periplasmic divalent cation tolerance protein
MGNEFCVVYVTAGKPAEAEAIASALVEERLAACCSLVSPVRSIYRWEGKICREEETLLVIKTRRALFGALRDRVLALHSYDVPEIVMLPIAEGHEAYMRWLGDETGG